MPLSDLKIHLEDELVEGDTGDAMWQEAPGVASYIFSNQAPNDAGTTQDQRAWIHIPPSHENDNDESVYPLLIVLHGSGKGSPHWSLEEQVASFEAIASQYGILVLCPESKGRTWDFVRSSCTCLFPESRNDVHFLQNALNAARRQFRVDDNRIAVKGISDGGSMSLCLATYNTSTFQACLSISAGFCKLDSDMKEDSDGVEEIIPNWETSQLPQLFLLHGENDSMFSLDKVGRKNEEKLRAAGFPVDFRVAAGQGQSPEGWESAFIKEWLSLSP